VLLKEKRFDKKVKEIEREKECKRRCKRKECEKLRLFSNLL
jgi:hypothetical protein